ncbi:MAG: hypothetical protein IJ595_09600 [Oscillospiraceae bacterium]|nr:hypothetical protein [Oscillospiraceae bacterium]
MPTSKTTTYESGNQMEQHIDEFFTVWAKTGIQLNLYYSMQDWVSDRVQNLMWDKAASETGLDTLVRDLRKTGYLNLVDEEKRKAAERKQTDTEKWNCFWTYVFSLAKGDAIKPSVMRLRGRESNHDASGCVLSAFAFTVTLLHFCTQDETLWNELDTSFNEQLRNADKEPLDRGNYPDEALLAALCGEDNTGLLDQLKGVQSRGEFYIKLYKYLDSLKKVKLSDWEKTYFEWLWKSMETNRRRDMNADSKALNSYYIRQSIVSQSCMSDDGASVVDWELTPGFRGQLLADSGMGKTVTSYALTLSAVSHYLTGAAYQPYRELYNYLYPKGSAGYPLLIFGSDVNSYTAVPDSELHLEEYLYCPSSPDDRSEKAGLMKAMKSRKDVLLLIVDAFDEVREENRLPLLDAVNTFCKENPQCRLLITSRIDLTRLSPNQERLERDYSSLYNGLRTWKILELSKGQIEDMIGKHNPELSREQVRDCVDAIACNCYLSELAKNPYTLSIMLTTTRFNGESGGTGVNECYETIISNMISHRWSDLEASLGCENSDDLRKALDYMAYRMACAGEKSIKTNKLREYLREANDPCGFDEAFIRKLVENIWRIAISSGVLCSSADGFRFHNDSFRQYLAACWIYDRLTGIGNHAKMPADAEHDCTLAAMMESALWEMEQDRSDVVMQEEWCSIYEMLLSVAYYKGGKYSQTVSLALFRYLLRKYHDRNQDQNRLRRMFCAIRDRKFDSTFFDNDGIWLTYSGLLDALCEESET